MTWTKSPDDFPDRLLELSDAAYRLHHAATVYANRIGLDGRIPRAHLGLVPVPPRTKRSKVVAELVKAGLWSEYADGVTILDFLEHQPSADEVRLQRRWDVLRQQIRFVKGPDRDAKLADLRREADAVRDELQTARNRRKALYSQPNSLVIHGAPLRPVPVPSRPAPSEVEDEDERAAGGALGGAPAASNEKCPECGLGFRSVDRVRVSPHPIHGGTPTKPVLVHDSWSECVSAAIRTNGQRVATALDNPDAFEKVKAEFRAHGLAR